MIRRTRYPLLIGCSLAAFVALNVPAAHAQTPANTTTPATTTQAADDDDDARLDPAEPDFTLVNLPTTLRLPVHAGNFHLTHRFNENLRSDKFTDQLSNLFGLDEGATIGLEFRFGIMKHLEATASRTNFNRTIQFSGKYDAVHQNASRPASLSIVASVEGQNNFRTQYSPAIGAVLSRTFASHAAVYVVPVFVGNSASGAVADQTTSYLGIGARIRIRPSVYLAGEVSPRLGGYVIGDPEYGFAIEKRVGAHMFSLTFANGHASTYSQIARGGNPESLYFGFNLARKFF